jgi:hypothetical protein
VQNQHGSNITKLFDKIKVFCRQEICNFFISADICKLAVNMNKQEMLLQISMLCVFCGQNAFVVDESDDVCENCCGWLVDEISPKLNMCPTCYLVTKETYNFSQACLCNNPKKVDLSQNKRYTLAELKTMYGPVPKVTYAPYTTPEGYTHRMPDIPLFNLKPVVNNLSPTGPEGQITNL